MLSLPFCLACYRGTLGVLALLTPLGACDGDQQAFYQGYVEGEFVYVAASEAGRLDRLAVTRGQQVSKGDALFALESEREAATQLAAQAQLAAAQAQLRDISTGKRPPELEVSRAQLAQALSESRRSAIQLARDIAQYRAGGIALAQLDDSRAQARSDAARVRALRAQLEVAHLPARDEQRVAQAAQVEAARAALAQADWTLAQKRLTASTAARVFDTLYREGEWVAAGNPVLVLLPPGNIKVRFFVPETVIGRLKIGQTAQLRCDACATPLALTLDYLSTQAEERCPTLTPRPASGSKAAMTATALAPDYAIDVQGLHKRFGPKLVVNDVSLRIGRGEIFGFLGPNGSGKTTCIRMMCGLLTPDSGSGTCLGYDILHHSAQIKRHVGYMTQRGKI